MPSAAVRGNLRPVLMLRLPGAALRATRHVERGGRRRVGEVTPASVDASLLVEAIRERPSHADERLERAAWRLLRRRSPGGGGAPSTSGAG
jgi:hypothetical protein